MIRAILAALVLALAACSQAESVAGASVFSQPAEDPVAHGNALAVRISREGMTPVREVFARMAQVTPQVSQAVDTLDTAIGGRPARSWQLIEDVTLSNTIRKIYYLHAFDGTLLFTRLDYVREGDTWYFVGFYFANNWELVASPTTPGFHSTNAPTNEAPHQ
jgi:hypothetical protein